MADLGRLLVIAGGVLIVAGVLLTYSGRLPWLGHLPGDIRIQREGLTLYLPLGTMLVVSLLLTLVVNQFIRWFR